MLWQLGYLALCLLLLVPIVRGLFAVHSLERRASRQPQSFILARAFHRPVYGTCLLLLGLRAVFFALTAINKLEEMGTSLKMATFALLDVPSVAMAALNGYILLFAVRLMFQRRWPGASSSGSNGILTAVFVAFCVSLVALVTLVAICRAEGDKWGFVVPQWVTFGYSAVIWTTLGLLMLKYQGQAVQILWRYRRRHQWIVTDGEKWTNNSRLKLPVLTIACLKNLAVCSTLLAELLVVRGVLCAVIASQNSEDATDIIKVVGSWSNVTLHYFCWEVASLVVVLRMLHRTPIAVHCFSDESRNPKTSAVHRKEAPSAPTIDDGEIQVEFQVPNVRGLLTDYVVPSNASLIAGRRQMEDETHGSGALEHHFCRFHDNSTPVGTEYVDCRCYREKGDDQFLSSANVPLLAEEYEPDCEERLSSGSGISTATDEDKIR